MLSCIFSNKVSKDKDTAVKSLNAFSKVTKWHIWECKLSFHSCFYYIIKSLLSKNLVYTEISIFQWQTKWNYFNSLSINMAPGKERWTKPWWFWSKSPSNARVGALLAPIPLTQRSGCRLILPLCKPILDSYITVLISLAGGKKKPCRNSIDADFKTQRKQLTMTFTVNWRTQRRSPNHSFNSLRIFTPWSLQYLWVSPCERIYFILK